MILYCSYCGTVFGLDVDTAPDRPFCNPLCQDDFGSGPTLPPDLDPLSEPSRTDVLRAHEEEQRQRGEDAGEWAADLECSDGH